MSERRELYRSPNGDCWFLGREPQDGRAFVIHQANGPSGAHLSHIDLGAFLSAETEGPERHRISYSTHWPIVVAGGRLARKERGATAYRRTGLRAVRLRVASLRGER
jgi:hypothetical protein